MIARSQSLSGWLLCLSILVIGVLLNWPVEYSNYISQTIGSQNGLFVDSIDSSPFGPLHVRIAMGGWPFTYVVTNTFADGAPSTHFNLGRLAANILFIAGAMVAGWLYEWRANHSSSSKPKSKNHFFNRRFSLSDLVLLLSLVGIWLGYWQSLASHVKDQAEKLEARADQKMLASLSVTLPDWLEKRTLGSNRLPFMRIRKLELDKPDNETLRFALSLDSLQSLRIGGGTYDLKWLNQLRKLPCLHDLRVSGRELNAEAIAAIANCKQLQSLNLMRTNITATGVHALGQLPHLRTLNLVHTDVRLEELGHPPIADNVTALALPHHPSVAEELIIEDWRELRSLQVFEYDTLSSSQPLRITLRRLPKLAHLNLDFFRILDVTLDEVPNLQQFESIAQQAANRVRKFDRNYSICLINSLKIRNSSIVKPLDCYASALHEIDIQSDRPVNMRLFSGHIQTADPKKNQQWLDAQTRHVQTLLDQLGRCSAPMTLDLSELLLEKADLTQFSRIQNLQSLKMAFSLPAAEALKLRHLPLRELELPGQLTAEQASEMIASIPTLEKLVMRWITFDRFQINNHKIKAIEGLDTSSDPRNQNEPSPGSAELVDLPNLVANVFYGESLTKVRIENVPAITHLRLTEPLPTGTILRGLRDLTCFGGGGKELRDAHFDAIVACGQLETLCLLHNSVSPHKLANIGSLSRLKCLSLNGSQVTDDVLASWTNLKSLRTLRLKQTQVTKDGLKLIPQLFPYLERLTIDTPIDEVTLDEILKCTSLVDLGMHGSILDAKSISKLSTLEGLVQLDLTGCTLDWTAIETLQQKNFSDNMHKRLLLTGTTMVSPQAVVENTSGSAVQPNPDGEVRLRFIHASSGSVQFYTPRYNKSREIWLDSEEIWDEPFVYCRADKKLSDKK